MDISSMHEHQYQEMLSHAQKTGLKYFHHLQKPVTRHESETAVVSLTSPFFQNILTSPSLIGLHS
jgi:hypothetical protein